MPILKPEDLLFALLNFGLGTGYLLFCSHFLSSFWNENVCPIPVLPLDWNLSDFAGSQLESN